MGRRRATKQEVAERVAAVKDWIVDTDDQIAFEEAVQRMTTQWRISRRQAIRYWVAAREALMDARQRYQRRNYKPMLTGRHGRYRSRPCL